MVRQDGRPVVRVEFVRPRLRYDPDYMLLRLACSRSIASNSALKLPLPNPCEPCHSISSKNTGVLEASRRLRVARGTVRPAGTIPWPNG